MAFAFVFAAGNLGFTIHDLFCSHIYIASFNRSHHRAHNVTVTAQRQHVSRISFAAAAVQEPEKPEF